MSRSNADLTKMVGMSSGESQDQRVETEVLEPASVSQQQAKFLLPQKGLLSSDVFLSFKMTAPNGNIDVPLMAGASGLIRRASIYYGNVLLQETDALPHLLQLKTGFVNQDIRDQTYQTKYGHFSGLKVDESAAGKKGMYSLDAEDDGTGITGLEALASDEYNKRSAFRLQTTAAATPEWTLPLRFVFPFLSQTQLPLGLLNDKISVVFDFNDDLPGMRSVINQAKGAAQNWAAGTDVVLDSVRLSMDLIYYDDQPGKPSPMARIAAALDAGMEMVYTDYTHVEENLPAIGAPGAPQVQTKLVRLGLDHQICRNILIATPQQADYAANPAGVDAFSNPILGDYNSLASQGQRTLQVKINNQNLFVNALDMDAKIYNELSQVFNTPFKANIGLTSNVGQVGGATLNYDNNQLAFPVDKFIYGHQEGGTTAAFTPHLSGSLGYMGVNLSRTYDNVLGAGTSIGKAPVELEITYTRTPQNFKQLRVLTWCENERIMMIKNGTIYVSGS